MINRNFRLQKCPNRTEMGETPGTSTSEHQTNAPPRDDSCNSLDISPGIGVDVVTSVHAEP
jgi:hypothetical protein